MKKILFILPLLFFANLAFAETTVFNRVNQNEYHWLSGDTEVPFGGQTYYFYCDIEQREDLYFKHASAVLLSISSSSVHQITLDAGRNFQNYAVYITEAPSSTPYWDCGNKLTLYDNTENPFSNSFVFITNPNNGDVVDNPAYFEVQLQFQQTYPLLTQFTVGVETKVWNESVWNDSNEIIATPLNPNIGNYSIKNDDVSRLFTDIYAVMQSFPVQARPYYKIGDIKYYGETITYTVSSDPNAWTNTSTPGYGGLFNQSSTDTQYVTCDVIHWSGCAQNLLTWTLNLFFKPHNFSKNALSKAYADMRLVFPMKYVAEATNALSDISTSSAETLTLDYSNLGGAWTNENVSFELLTPSTLTNVFGTTTKEMFFTAQRGIIWTVVLGVIITSIF